jgi:hypothetical protein
MSSGKAGEEYTIRGVHVCRGARVHHPSIALHHKLLYGSSQTDRVPRSRAIAEGGVSLRRRAEYTLPVAPLSAAATALHPLKILQIDANPQTIGVWGTELLDAAVATVAAIAPS